MTLHIFQALVASLVSALIILVLNIGIGSVYNLLQGNEVGEILTRARLIFFGVLFVFFLYFYY